MKFTISTILLSMTANTRSLENLLTFFSHLDGEAGEERGGNADGSLRKAKVEAVVQLVVEEGSSVPGHVCHVGIRSMGPVECAKELISLSGGAICSGGKRTRKDIDECRVGRQIFHSGFQGLGKNGEERGRTGKNGERV